MGAQGNVDRWNDDTIAELNPDVDLPSTRILLVYRAGASGTSMAFFFLGELVETGPAKQVFTPRPSKTREPITGRFG